MRTGFQRVMIEALEGRELLSAGSIGMHSCTASIVAGSHAHGIGKTLILTQNISFTGQVAFLSGVTPPTFGTYSASIHWGDGTISDATLQYVSTSTMGGYAIIGTHTYTEAGNFRITTIVSVNPPTGSLAPTRLIGRIISKAHVAPTSATTSGQGVALNETSSQSFTANVGSFSVIAPARNMTALINWGDGTTSAGTISPAGVIGIDVLSFTVAGTHTYPLGGSYLIHTTIVGGGLAVSTAALRTIASIDSTAVVTAPTLISLAGTLTGTYTMPALVPDLGQSYHLTGTGNAGDLATVTADGFLNLPGLILFGRAQARITLTNATGWVTIALTGPTESGFGPAPTTYSYVVTAASGAYAGDAASGSATLTLVPATTTDPNSFTLLLA